MKKDYDHVTWELNKNPHNMIKGVNYNNNNGITWYRVGTYSEKTLEICHLCLLAEITVHSVHHWKLFQLERDRFFKMRRYTVMQENIHVRCNAKQFISSNSSLGRAAPIT